MKTGHGTVLIISSILTTGLFSNKADAKLVAYWKLDETTGKKAIDSSGNGNTGTLCGESNWAPDKGKNSGAVYFGNTDGDHLEIPITQLSAHQGTISLWFNIAANYPSTRYRYLFGHGAPPYWSNRIQIYMLPEDSHLSLGLGDTHTLFTYNNPPVPERWYHVTLIWNHGNYFVYIDGVKQACGTYNGLEKLNSTADIGNDGRTDGNQRNESFHGLIDNVVLFNHALSEYEITQLHYSTADMFTSEEFMLLLENINGAMEISDKQSHHEATIYLEKKIAEYHQWEQRNPNDVEPDHKRLSCELYFLLAKTKEAASAPPKETTAAYKQSISYILYRKNYVPGLLWLFENIPAEEYMETIKNSIQRSDCIPENLNLVAEDFESSKNWPAFELYLDAVFSGTKDVYSFAQAINSGLAAEGPWQGKFMQYVRNKPQLSRFCIDTLENNAKKKIAQSEFSAAAEIYRDIISLHPSQYEKASYQLKLYECLLESGQYQKTLSELDDFIKNTLTTDKKLIVKAILLKGQILIQLNKIETAREILSNVIKDYPETSLAPELCFFIGYCNMLQGNNQEAEKSLQLVIDNYPQSSYANKAYLYLAANNKAKNKISERRTSK